MSYYEEYWQQNARWNPSGGGWRDREHEMLLKVASKGTRLIDYGCGDCDRISGRIMSEGILYEGFDISETAVSSGQQRGVPAFVLSGSGGVDRPAETYDAALCLEVMEHLMRPDLAAAEIFRILKPGGRALISVPNPSYFPQRIEFLLTGFLNPGGSPLTSRSAPWKDAHIRFFTLSTMRRMLKETGFRSCEAFGFPFTLQDFPWLYRQKGLFPLFAGLKKVLGWLGPAVPSVFAPRWYFLAQK